MLEVAITSIKCALRDEYPEFREFFESEGWKKEPEVEVEVVCEEADCADGEAEIAPEATDVPEVSDCETEQVNPTEDEDDA